MNKIITVGLALIIGLLGYQSFFPQKEVIEFSGTDSIATTASSTTDTLAQTSKSLFGTSTKRVAFAVQPVGCTAPGAFVRLAQGRGEAAATTSGLAVFATTTQTFDDHNIVFPTGNIQGITTFGTCTVILTEWRTNF